MKNNETFEIHIFFKDKNKHDIDLELLSKYHNLLYEIQKEYKVKIKVQPSQNGGWVEVIGVIGGCIAIGDLLYPLLTGRGLAEDLKSINGKIKKSCYDFYHKVKEYDDIRIIKYTYEDKKEGKKNWHYFVRSTQFTRLIELYKTEEDDSEDKNEYDLTNDFKIKKIIIAKNGDIRLTKDDKDKLKEVEKIKIKKEKKDEEENCKKLFENV